MTSEENVGKKPDKTTIGRFPTSRSPEAEGRPGGCQEP